MTQPQVLAETSPPITLRRLLEAGVHFGHPTKRWNPKMDEYIYTKRNKIHVFDLSKTLTALEAAAEFVSGVVSGGGQVMLVGTKKQAQEPIGDAGVRTGALYVNQRWLGGMLTNFQTIQRRIEYLVRLEEEIAHGTLHVTTKREAQKAATEVARLNKFLGGIKHMTKLPDVLFVVDIGKERIAVAEATRLKIPVVAIVDTNCDPTTVQYPIPGNDDAVRSVRIITDRIADAILDGAERHRQAVAEQMAIDAEIEEQEEAARRAAQAEAAARLAVTEAARREAEAAASPPAPSAGAPVARPAAEPAGVVPSPAAPSRAESVVETEARGPEAAAEGAARAEAETPAPEAGPEAGPAAAREGAAPEAEAGTAPSAGAETPGPAAEVEPQDAPAAEAAEKGPGDDRGSEEKPPE